MDCEIMCVCLPACQHKFGKLANCMSRSSAFQFGSYGSQILGNLGMKI